MSTIAIQLLENLNESVGFARNRLADLELAVDADQVRDDESAKAWFYRILRRTIIDLYRRRDVRERLTQTCRLCAKHGGLNCTCDTTTEKEG